MLYMPENRIVSPLSGMPAAGISPAVKINQ
jgi:hypothetical protein